MRNVHRFATALATVLLLAGLAACKTTSSPHQQVDDGAIKASVKAKLAADVRLSTLTNVEVNSTDGVVTLAGKVKSDGERRMAAEVAHSVDGVVRVNNELQVESH
jgi:hyperosmotically inducible protein